MSADQTTTARASRAQGGFGARLRNALPDRVDGRVRFFGWLSLIVETTIIATGGAVRLTGSGLGCPTWPTCTPESLVPTPEMGLHGFIEFGNRTMSGVVGIVALIVLVLVWRIRRERRDLFALALVVPVGVVAQAVVGGVTVLTGLNPFIVGFHYVVSLLLVCTCAVFLVRAYAQPLARVSVVPRWFAILGHVTGLALAVTIAFGVLTTSSGPHSGDAAVVRDGFDASVLAHVHSWPGYALVALLGAATVAAWALRLRPRRWLTAALAVVAVQIGVGVWQAREGLPEMLVGIHMVLAALSAAAYTVATMRMKQP
ncbi:MAG: COX15/CtaA family protein [Microbacterium sp.]|uniref:COX15/CtaA family protein n=1 Tax=Microbacterium sp. TaxID=51671 RepID=UPI0039E3E41A